ncbi:MAG TPA: pyridoxal-phosphate dependent enzyme [Polyangiaceae bacterium]
MSPKAPAQPAVPPPSLPTPLYRATELGSARVELWIKNDGVSHALYGGNKVRKLVRLIAEAKRRGARRVLTIGAAGSHHVLTTAIFCRAAGLRSAAAMFPQPLTPHVLETFRATLGQGAEIYPTDRPSLVALTAARAFQRGDYFVPPGGSNLIGTLGYFDAVSELAAQLVELAVPVPDYIVVALGSGGTMGGIAAGVLARGFGSRVVGVHVLGGAPLRAVTRRLAARALRVSGGRATRADLERVLTFDTAELGQGYGHSTPQGTRASELAAQIGLTLDATYTAKAFSGALALCRRLERASEPGVKRVLYWHTLSAQPLEPLLALAPSEAELPDALRVLFTSKP